MPPSSYQPTPKPSPFVVVAPSLECRLWSIRERSRLRSSSSSRIGRSRVCEPTAHRLLLPFVDPDRSRRDGPGPETTQAVRARPESRERSAGRRGGRRRWLRAPRPSAPGLAARLRGAPSSQPSVVGDERGAHRRARPAPLLSARRSAPISQRCSSTPQRTPSATRRDRSHRLRRRLSRRRSPGRPGRSSAR